MWLDRLYHLTPAPSEQASKLAAEPLPTLLLAVVGLAGPPECLLLVSGSAPPRRARAAAASSPSSGWSSQPTAGRQLQEAGGSSLLLHSLRFTHVFPSLCSSINLHCNPSPARVSRCRSAS